MTGVWRVRGAYVGLGWIERRWLSSLMWRGCAWLRRLDGWEMLFRLDYVFLLLWPGRAAFLCPHAPTVDLSDLRKAMSSL